MRQPRHAAHGCRPPLSAIPVSAASLWIDWGGISTWCC
jgi:hypothetical protein